MRSIKKGMRIRFNNDYQCECLVTRVTEYSSFAEMMSKEDHRKINPDASAEQQLTEIGRIFPKEKEALGVIVYELQKV
jgi:ASC-1-like (ASCH) protein